MVSSNSGIRIFCFWTQWLIFGKINWYFVCGINVYWCYLWQFVSDWMATTYTPEWDQHQYNQSISTVQKKHMCSIVASNYCYESINWNELNWHTHTTHMGSMCASRAQKRNNNNNSNMSAVQSSLLNPTTTKKQQCNLCFEQQMAHENEQFISDARFTIQFLAFSIALIPTNKAIYMLPVFNWQIHFHMRPLRPLDTFSFFFFFLLTAIEMDPSCSYARTIFEIMWK